LIHSIKALHRCCADEASTPKGRMSDRIKENGEKLDQKLPSGFAKGFFKHHNWMIGKIREDDSGGGSSTSTFVAWIGSSCTL
jgi:hypothetical protein